MALSTDTVAPDVWRSHYATPRGFRQWPCEELVRAVGDRKLGVVLEVGCGNGANLWFLAEHATRVVGVDSCPEALTAARTYVAARGRSTVCLQHGDVLQLPLPDTSVDSVVDCMVSQHLRWSECPRAFAEYRRVLKPGGWLFRYDLGRGTTTTGAKRLENFTYDELPAVFPGVGPVCLPQGPALEAALTAAGFHPSPLRQLSRTYGDGAVTTYHITEARAV